MKWWQLKLKIVYDLEYSDYQHKVIKRGDEWKS